MISKAIIALAVLAFGAGTTTTAAHQPVVSAEGLRTWTHGDHANDPIGVAACIQNRWVGKCLLHNGGIYRFTAPYPQVPPNPVHAGKTELLTTAPLGYEWRWSTTAIGPNRAPGFCVTDWRWYLPIQFPLSTTIHGRACLSAVETTATNQYDVGRNLGQPPDDFIRVGL
jgi:hypothetical protein